MIRWEEKAIAQAAEKRGVKVALVDLKEMEINLTGAGTNPKIRERIVLQRCVSHYKNLYSTAALEAAGHTVVNSLYTAWNSSDKAPLHPRAEEGGHPDAGDPPRLHRGWGDARP